MLKLSEVGHCAGLASFYGVPGMTFDSEVSIL